MANAFEDPASYWNDTAGSKWVQAQDAVDRILAPITAHLLDACSVRAGERVVDIGCGSGTTTLALADRVGSTGRVVGVDISQPLFDHASSRSAGLDQVTLACADAATFQFETGWADLVTSRFGVMFFPDSVRAFSNIRTSLAANGRLAFVCWQTITKNPWLTFVMGAFPDAEMPLPPPEAGPGPFRLADPAHVREVLERSGFSNVRLDSFAPRLQLGTTAEEVLATMSGVGPFSRMLAEASETDRPRLLARARIFIEKECEDGPPALESGVWLVCATASP